MSRKVIVFLAEGFEDVEAVTPIDYLRRAGAEVTVAAVRSDKVVKSSRGLSMVADATVSELASAAGRWTAAAWDAVVVPGGMPGAANIAASAPCSILLKALSNGGKIVAAICAAPPVVLAPLGLLERRRFTCFPGMEREVAGARWSDDRVVVDGNLITSRAAGTAGEWAKAIVSKLFGDDAAEKLAKAVLIK